MQRDTVSSGKFNEALFGLVFFQALHKAELLDKDFDKLKKKVEEATKTKNYSQKELNREIADLTEVISQHFFREGKTVIASVFSLKQIPIFAHFPHPTLHFFRE